MIQQRLLQRLANANQQTMTKQPQQVALSIASNIVNILNTRLGSVVTRDDLGMPELYNATVIDKAELSQTANYILGQINGFETRLNQVTVECHSMHADINVLLKIIIRAQLNDEIPQSLTLVLFCMSNGKIVLQDVSL